MNIPRQAGFTPQNSKLVDIFRPKGLGTNAKNEDTDRYLDREQVQGILRAARNDRTVNGVRAYPLFAIMANLGIRVSEALDLTREDFRYMNAERFVIVHRRKKRGDRSKDNLVVSSLEKEVLERILSRLPQTGRLFCFGVRTAQHLFGYFCQLAGLRNVFSPHSLRRFVSCEMDDAGIRGWVISKRLGHHIKEQEEGYKRRPSVFKSELEKKPIVE